jgi:hypothetical protein
MRTLAHALSQLSEDSELGKMVKKVVKNTKVVRKKKIKLINNPVKRYRSSIRKTAWYGVGSLRPCSLLIWRPGRPVQSDGKPGRIKWGLSDGKLEFVVMVFDFPQTLHGTDSTTEYGLVHVSTLSRCDCAGYLHGRHCMPNGRTQ